MKIILIYIGFCAILLACSNKNMYTYDSSKLSPYTRQLMEALKEDNFKNLSGTLIAKYQLKEDAGQYYVKGLLKVQESFDEGTLKALGIKQMTNAGTIRTVRIPIKQISTLSKTNGIDLIEIDRPLKSN